MSYIKRDKPILASKKKTNRQGIKNDLWIFRIVAQSKGNSLSFTELRRKAGNTSIYKTLNRLCPRTDDIQGIRLFCYNDLIRETKMSDGEYNDLLIRLRRKIKDSYDHFLQWRNWRKIKPVIVDKEAGIKLITIQYDKNNLIILKLIPRIQARQDKDKAILIFRKKKFARNDDDISKYTKANNTLLRFSHFGLRNFNYFSFRNRRNYVTGKIPLFPERKESKLYFRTLSERSYYSSQYSRRYLDKISTEHGQILSMNIKGLLLYALDESNYEEFNKSLENLAESDEYQKILDSIDTYNEFGQTKTDFPIYFNYRIKREFPFLSHYNVLREILPPNFAAKLIKKIAVKLKDRLKISGREYLKCIVTEQFFGEIKREIEIQNNNPNFDDNVNRAMKDYMSEINTYLAHEKVRGSTAEQNIKILSSVEDRRNSLVKKLDTIIKNNNENNNNQVIPIYESIIESRLSWFDISEVLKSIATRHVKRYIITDRCLISKSKAKELKPLLKNGPTYDDACLSLIDNGVPRQCISEELFHKLGFQSTFRKSYSKNTISIIKRKEPEQRQKIHVYHDDAKKVSEVRLI